MDSKVPEFLTPFIEEKLQKSYSTEYKASEDLASVCRYGEHLATNVVVASKIQQKEEIEDDWEHDKEIDGMLSLEKQAGEALDKFLATWERIDEIKVPEQLRKLLIEQKQECDRALKSKDVAIEKLQKELDLKRENAAIFGDRRKQELQMVSRRMDQLAENLSQYTQNELQIVRSSLIDVQKEMTTHCKDAVEETVLKDEEQYVKYDDYDVEVHGKMRDVHRSLQVEYGKLQVVRMNLSKEFQSLLLKLQETQANQFLNLDKMVYGIHVLQEQIRENKMIGSEVKRSSIKSFDILLRLRAQLKSMNQSMEEEYQQVVSHHNKTFERIQASIKAAKFLHDSHKKKFAAIFKQKEREAQNLLYNVLKTDRFIFEVLFQTNWEAPDLSFLHNSPVVPVPNEQKLLNKLKSFLLPPSEPEDTSESSSQSFESNNETCLYLRRPLDIEKLLVFMCEGVDFLIDRYVLKMVKTVFPDLKSFIISNSVFNILGIKTHEDLNLLLAYILKCSNPISEKEVVVSHKNIIMALNAFVESQKDKMESDELVFNVELSTDPRENVEFWNCFSSVFTPTQIDLWDNVMLGLKDYVDHLQTKVQLMKKRKCIIQQNKEIERLLQIQLKNDGVI